MIDERRLRVNWNIIMFRQGDEEEPQRKFQHTPLMYSV